MISKSAATKEHLENLKKVMGKFFDSVSKLESHNPDSPKIGPVFDNYKDLLKTELEALEVKQKEELAEEF